MPDPLPFGVALVPGEIMAARAQGRRSDVDFAAKFLPSAPVPVPDSVSVCLVAAALA